MWLDPRSERIAARVPKSNPGRFELLLKDRATGKLTVVDLRPLNLEAVLTSIHRERRMLLGFVLGALLNAAKKLVPEFVVTDAPRVILGEPYHLEKPEPTKRRTPSWMRRLSGGEDVEDAQSLAEYALVLALVAVVAIVALVFLGTQIQDVLSHVGESV